MTPKQQKALIADTFSRELEIRQALATSISQARVTLGVPGSTDISATKVIEIAERYKAGYTKLGSYLYSGLVPLDQE